MKCCDCIHSYEKFDKRIDAWVAACPLTEIAEIIEWDNKKERPLWDRNLGRILASCEHHELIIIDGPVTPHFPEYVHVPRYVLDNAAMTIHRLEKKLHSTKKE